MELGKMYKFLAPLVLASGCMTFHDQKISSIKFKSECGLEQGAVFQNAPYYLSEGEEHAPIGRISRLFGAYDESIAQVKLQKTGNHLFAQFFDSVDKKIVSSVSAEGKEYQSNGEHLIINKWSSCKPGEAAIGCTWSHIELSCTQESDLVVRGIKGGAGLIALVIPMVASSSYLAIYKHIPDKK